MESSSSAGPASKKLMKRLILELDPETKEPLIEVDESIVSKLKPHQGDGIKFMYTTCFESLEMIKKGKAGGCILAHCMGLGKTLQVIFYILF
jgi:transcriptional regulator ATRX